MELTDQDAVTLASLAFQLNQHMETMLGDSLDQEDDPGECLTLTRREVAILVHLHLYRYNTDTVKRMREVLGKHFGVTPERIRQIESRTKSKMAGFSARHNGVIQHPVNGGD